MNDLKFAFRQLRKSPAFTAIAVITLALGIGLNTAIFSLINDLFLKGLPFQEPGRVLHILTKGKDRTDEFQMSAPRFMLYRDGQTIFSGFAAENQEAATVTGLGDPLSILFSAARTIPAVASGLVALRTRMLRNGVLRCGHGR